jgi:hypothetical protein
MMLAVDLSDSVDTISYEVRPPIILTAAVSLDSAEASELTARYPSGLANSKRRIRNHENNQRCAVCDAELFVDAVQMKFCGAHRNIEPTSNLFVR